MMKMSTCLYGCAPTRRPSLPPSSHRCCTRPCPSASRDLAARVAVREAGDAGEVDDRDDLDVAARAERVVDRWRLVLRVARHEGHRHDVAAQRREVERCARARRRACRANTGPWACAANGTRRAGSSKRSSPSARQREQQASFQWLPPWRATASLSDDAPLAAAVAPSARRGAGGRAQAGGLRSRRRSALLRRRARRGGGGQPAAGRLERRSDGIRRVRQGPSARQGRQAGDVPARLRRAQGGPLQRRGARLRCAGQDLPAARRLRAAVRGAGAPAAGRATQALDRAKRVPPESALDGEARFLRGEAERAAANNAEARRRVSLRISTAIRRAGARPRCAFAWPRRSTPSATRRRRASSGASSTSTSPADSWGKQAAAHVGASPTPPSPPTELARRAMVLFDAMRNGESESEWKRVLGAPGLDDKLACVAMFHGAQSVFKARAALARGAAVRRRRRGVQQGQGRGPPRQGALPGRAQLGTKGRSTTTPRRARRRRCSRRCGASTRCTATPTTRACARRRSTTRSRTRPRSNELLVGLPVAFAGGDQRGEALWRLAFRAWRKGDVAGAARFLRAGAARCCRARRAGGRRGARSTGSDASPTRAATRRRRPICTRARRGSIRCRTTRCSRSIGCARSGRSGRGARRRAQALRRPATTTAGSSRARPLFGEPGFRRGVELARLGLGAEAKRELALAGIEVPKKRGAITPDAEREELLWLAAVLYDRAGEYAISHFIPRHLLTAYEREWPVGANRKRWLLQLSARLSRAHREARGAQRAAGGARVGHRARGVGRSIR